MRYRIADRAGLGCAVTRWPGKVWRAVGLLLPLLLPAAISHAAPADRSGSTWLPEQAATTAQHVDRIFDFLLYLSAFFFLLILTLIVVFVCRYRRRHADQKTSANDGNTRLEITWAAIPTVLLVVIFVWGFRGWMELNIPPADAMEVQVIARKWTWEFSYPADNVSGAAELVVPIGKPIKLIMSSDDVIHSLFVPAFRIKRDVLPNRYSVVWFEATKLGTFDIFCTELCGQGHSQMLSRVRVVNEGDFRSWLESGGGQQNLSPQELGQQLYAAKGCVACHSTGTNREGKPGPPLGGLFGKTRPLAGGDKVKVDEDYLRESILEPKAKMVPGFEPVMPPFKGAIKAEQLDALIVYIKSLK